MNKMSKLINNDKKQQLKHQFLKINKELLKNGYKLSVLKDICVTQRFCVPVTVVLCFLAILIPFFIDLKGTRCLIPNNYFIWESTRPISSCEFCLNVSKPIILHNLTQETFSKFAYSSKPIIVKNAVKLNKKISFDFLKHLFETTKGSYESVDQFLHFNSDFYTLKDVFSMSNARANFLPGEKSWYIGWCSTNTNILNKIREIYSLPNFLPRDSEISNREYIFMGYDQGANMHLDFISRLMWQIQIFGNKTWNLIPSPECEHICQNLSFYVEPNDIMFLDTRVWYHSTSIANRDFSLTIQSEYS